MAVLFDEDVVRRIHHGAVQYGLVIQNSEGFSSDSDSDEESRSLKAGQICVAWYPKGREEVLSERKVVLQDRSLMPGDAVRRVIQGEDSQRGIVHNVEVYTHVQILKTKQMIYGARCAVPGEDAAKLTQAVGVTPDCVFYREAFYPSQVLTGPARVFRSAEWLSGHQPVLSSTKNFKVVVEEVQIVGVDVHWQTRGYSGQEDSGPMEPPNKAVKADELQKLHALNHFVPASIQVGDKGLYRITDNDLKYPQPVALGSVYCYQRPPTPTEDITFPPFTQCVNLPSRDLECDGDSGANDDKIDLHSVTKSDTVGAESQIVDKSSNIHSLSSESGLQKSSECNTEDKLGSSVNGHCEHKDISEILKLKSDSAIVIENEHRTDPAADAELNSESLVVVEMQPNLSDSSTNAASCNGNVVEQSAALCPNTYSISKQIRETVTKVRSLCAQKITSLDASQIRDDLDSLEKLHDQLVEEMSREASTIFDKVNDLTDQMSGVCVQRNRDDEKVDELIVLNERLSGEVKNTQELMVMTKHLMQHLNETCKKAKHELEAAKHGITAIQSGRRKSKRRCDRRVNEKVDVSSSEEVSDEEEGDEDGDDEDDDDDDNSSQVGSIKSITSSQGSVTCRKENKVISSSLMKHRNQVIRMRGSRRKKVQPPEQCYVGDVVCIEVTHTETVVDVKWQDGVLEKGISSSDLFPTHQLDELEFFPGDFVSKSDHENWENMYGLVSKANHQDRTCTVKWIRKPTKSQPLPECLSSEEVSVYDLQPHTDFTFNVGDVVCRLHGICNDQDSSHQVPCAGQVKWVNVDGTICVVWYDNETSNVPPQDLFKLDDDYDDSDWSEDSSDWDDSDMTDSEWETQSSISTDISDEDIEKIIVTSDGCHEVTVFVEGKSTVASDDKTDAADVSAEPLAAVEENDEQNDNSDIVTVNAEKEDVTVDGKKSNSEEHIEEKKKGEVRCHDKCTNDVSSVDMVTKDEVNGVTVAATDEGIQERQKDDINEEDHVHETKNTDTELNVEIEGDVCNETHNTAAVRSSGFCLLDCVPDTHYFKSATFTSDGFAKKLTSIISKELKLLQSSLPPGILVKSFADRMDLFSVMISGPAKTPYEDGLFIFDVQLSVNYPQSPPIFHYVSFCAGRLNPNLYNDGKVCVSLLGTWTGKSMASMVSNLPEIFKDEVIVHCKRHGMSLVHRVESWLTGNQSGEYPETGFPLFPLSKGFILSVKNPLESIRQAVRKLGVQES
uniref:Ubiquitin-conjugating enzyme E2 O-like n=1 Tax=Saccoglossus kowalevskii TaxID=10224 RepID=A0ABM0MHK4_SACKO|nr:PREDICTED: ubiquitin-conjugating enzyme E2 O-like [Saccoglossus kowalevskii]